MLTEPVLVAVVVPTSDLVVLGECVGFLVDAVVVPASDLVVLGDWWRRRRRRRTMMTEPVFGAVVVPTSDLVVLAECVVGLSVMY